MLKIYIEGFGDLHLKYLLSDYTGTLSENGTLIDGVGEKLSILSNIFDEIHILTADTFGTVSEQLKHYNVNIHILKGIVGEQKLKILQDFGAEYCAVIGNGNNDIQIASHAKVSVAVINKEGCSSNLIQHSDIVTCSIIDALNLFINTKQLRATLRG